MFTKYSTLPVIILLELLICLEYFFFFFNYGKAIDKPQYNWRLGAWFKLQTIGTQCLHFFVVNLNKFCNVLNCNCVTVNCIN